jgi:hypothetical protein
VLLAAQREHLQNSFAAFVHLAGEVVERGDLPAAGFGDPATRPRKNVLVAAELSHRLADSDELMRRAEVCAEQRDDRLRVSVEHGEALARPAHRERPVVVAPCDRVTVGGESGLAERRDIADRIDLEEVLVLAAEAHHPGGELVRIGDARVADLRVQVQQFAREIRSSRWSHRRAGSPWGSDHKFASDNAMR